MPTTPIRIGIIGAGVIARHHATAATRLPRPVELSVTDPNPDATRAFAGQLPQARVLPDLAALLAGEARPDDIIINATPPRFHRDATVAALNAGRHVLCEKPLALNLDQARDMLAAARANHRLLGCCSIRFADIPATARIKHLINTAALGDLYHVSFVNRAQRARTGVEYQPTSRWFLDPAHNGGGVVMDWGPYDIAALTEVFRPTRIDIRSAWCATPLTGRDPFEKMLTEQHAGASLILHTPDGRTLPVTYERAACTHGEPRTNVEIEGTRGAVRWEWCNNKGTVHLARDTAGDVTVETETHPVTDNLGPHDRPLHYFYHRVMGEPSPALVNEHALFNFTLLRALYTAAQSNHPQTVELD